MKRLALALVALSTFAAGSLRAQQSADLVTAGLHAYRALQYDRAAELLRRSLATSGPAALGDSARAATLVYLGAAHLFRGRGDSAVSAFRSALATNPRCRPDSLIFPPEVGTAFERVRRGTAYVAIVVPADTVVPADGAYLIHLYASAPHRAEVRVGDADRNEPRRLFAGMIGDSALVRWPARDSLGAILPKGSATLAVTSRPESGSDRTVRQALELGPVGADTSDLPPRPPDPTPSRPAPLKPAALRYGSLAAGVVPAMAVIFLPSLLSIDGGGNGARFAVGGALGVAGVIGLLSGRTRKSPPAIVPGPSAAITAWRRAVDSIHVENERRVRTASLRIRRVGEPPPVR